MNDRTAANLAQAKLLLLDAQNRMAMPSPATTNCLGSKKQQSYLLAVQTAAGAAAAPPQNPDQLLAMAFRSRPDLAAVEDQWQSAQRFRRAEHDLYRRTLSALAAVGEVPLRADQILPW